MAGIFRIKLRIRTLITLPLLLGFITGSVAFGQQAPPGAAVTPLHDYVFTGVPNLPAENHYMVFVLGAETPKGAQDQFNCIRRTNPSLPIGVFHFKNMDMVGDLALPYALFSGSYESKADAEDSLKELLSSINYDSIFDCMNGTDVVAGATAINARDIAHIVKIPTYGELVSIGDAVSLTNPPSFDIGNERLRTPLAPFDGIGHGVYSSGTDTARAVVHYRPVTSADEAASVLNDYQARFPDIHFAILKYGGLYYVEIAGLTNKQTIDDALLAAYRRGLYEFAAVDNLPPLANSGKTTQTPLIVKTIVAHPKLPNSFVVTSTDSTMPTTLERASLLEPVKDRVVRCYKQILSADSKANPTSDQVSACAGVVLTPKMLTRCLVGSDCVGAEVPVNINMDPKDVIQTCIAASLAAIPDPTSGLFAGCAAGTGQDQCGSDLASKAMTSCEATTLDLPFIKTLVSAGLGPCISSLASDCADPGSAIKHFCMTDAGKKICSQYSSSINGLVARASTVARCINAGNCESIVPRFGYTPNDFAIDIARMGQIAEADATPDPAGIQFLQNQAGIANAFQACKKLQDNGDPTAYDCFVNLGLNDSEQAIYRCMKAAGNDPSASTKCAVSRLPKAAQDAIKQGQCIGEGLKSGIANLDSSKLASCGGVDSHALAQAQQSVDCARKQSSAADVLFNCVGNIPPQVVDTWKCANSLTQGSDPVLVFSSCLPNGLGDKQVAAKCLVGAGNDQQKLNCISQFLGNVSPEVQSAISCANQHSSDTDASAAATAIASCISPSLAPSAALQSAAASAMSCVKKTGVSSDPLMLVSCLPDGFGDKLGAAKCITGAPDDQSRTACVAQLLGNLPPSLQQSITCASQFTNVPNSNDAGTAVASCVVGNMLPSVALQKGVIAAVKCAKDASTGDDALSTISSCLPDGFGDKADAAKCVANTADEQARVDCVSKFLGNVGPQIQQLVACADQYANNSGTTPATTAISSCIASKLLPSKELQDALTTAVNCAKNANASTDAATLAASCLPGGYGDKVAAANCIVTAATDAAKLVCVSNMLGNIDPKIQQAALCAQQHQNDGNPSQIATGIGSCIAQNYLPANVVQAGQCLATANTDVDRAACIGTAAGVDPKTVATGACLAKSGGNTESMAMCAAAAILPPQFSKIAQCAAQSTGEIDFALCVSGASLNPEWRIAAECASESGGEPMTFAGCTAGRLTMRELQKCLSGQIGTDGGCFGPSNDLVKAIGTIANDLTHGLGENNDIVKALGTITNPIRDGVAAIGSGLQHFGDQARGAIDRFFGVSW